MNTELIENMKKTLVDAYRFSGGKKNAARQLAIVYSKTPLCPVNWLKIAASLLNNLE